MGTDNLRTNKSIKALAAFTLAEVLITLGIIGVVAQMTIPTLNQRVQQQQLATEVKKFTSDFERGMKQILINNGCETLQCTGIYDSWGTPAFTTRIVQEMQAAFKNVDYCTSSCEHDFTYGENIGGTSLSGWGTNRGTATNPLFRLGNGAFLIFKSGADSTSPISRTRWFANFVVDVNGHKKPNIYGKDIHWIHASNEGVFFPDYGKMYCEAKYNQDFKTCPEYWELNNSCNPSSAASTGDGCLARIIENSWTFDFW